MENIQIPTSDGLKLFATLFHAEEGKGIVQVIHGAKEHRKRYYTFAKHLQEQGFHVILSDNRGHGESINDAYPLGFMNRVEEIIADQLLVTDYIKNLYPNLPFYLFGHSLGSVFARIYLQKQDENVDKVILSGAVNYVPGVSFGIFLGKTIAKISGKHGYNRFLEKLSFKNQKNDLWISVSEENLKKYRNDPLCQYKYQIQATITVFEGVRELNRLAKYECHNPNLPFLFISGEGDPITGGEKGLKDSIKKLEKIGYHNIENIIYPNMNHEVLNENNKEIVYDDIVQFLLQ